MARRIPVVVLSTAFIVRCGSTPTGPPAATPPPASAARAPAAESTDARLARTLGDAAIWGRDFASVLRALPAFTAAGERTVMVFDHRVAGERRHPNEEDARRAAASVGERLAAAPAIRPVLALPAPRVMLPSPAPVRLPDDRAFHVTSTAPDAQFLVPGLRIDTVRQRLGAAAGPERLVIDDGTERRPLILDVYSYDDGAVRFATDIGAADPSAVERVFLDAGRISAGLF